MKPQKILALILTIVTVLTAMSVLAACGGNGDGAETSISTGAGATGTGSAETNVTPDKNTKVNVMVLNGTTGFGMAQLMDKSAKGEASLDYTFSVETDASIITGALLNGTADIAALPTNAAANLYAKKAGSVQVLAVNTLGVLYLMTGEETTVTSFEDLRGKTVYCPAQNPAFIFSYLCKKNGLEPGTDLTIDTTSYAQPADLRNALVAGNVDIAVLPEPMVTIAKSAAAKDAKILNVALDLTAEWDKVAPAGSLGQGCVVVRSDFAKENPAAVVAFLNEYKVSINFVKENPDEAGAMIQAQNIFAQGSVAAKAIPNCNLCYVTGNEMRDLLNAFYSVLFEVAPASIGGSVPDDGLYYGLTE